MIIMIIVLFLIGFYSGYNYINKNKKNTGCVNVPPANFKPPQRPPSQYRKIELSKENIYVVNKCKCCNKVNSCKLK